MRPGLGLHSKFQASQSYTYTHTHTHTHTHIVLVVRIYIPAQNIMTKKQVGEERVYSAYTSMLLLITKGLKLKQVRKQELMQRPWRDVPYWLASPGIAKPALL